MHAPAVVAGTIFVVAMAAKWCVLACSPLSIRVSMLGVAPVAIAARTPATIHAGAIERLGVTCSEDLQRHKAAA